MGYQHINVLLPVEVYRVLREYCKKNDKTISDVVRSGLFHVLGLRPGGRNFEATK